MPTTPNWSAAKNGMPGDLDATDHASQVYQELGTHKASMLYKGARVVTPAGGDQFAWTTSGASGNVSQPFTMSGTAIGRLSIPMQPVGSGASVLVKLCPDNGSGAPDVSNVLSSCLLPAAWQVQLAAADGLEGAGPLAGPSFNTLYPANGVTTRPFSFPTAFGSSNVLDATYVSSGSYLISAGGLQPVGQFSRIVATMRYLGEGTLDLPVAQSPLPVGTANGAMVTVGGSIVYAGGAVGIGSANVVSTTYTASWDPNTGLIGAWTAQAPLPSPGLLASSASWNNFVYLIGGENSSATPVNTVLGADCSSGVISSWTRMIDYPTAVTSPSVGVIGNLLIVAGGYDGTFTPIKSVYYAYINPDGTLSGWNESENLVVPQSAASNTATNWGNVITANAVVLFTGDDGSVGTSPIQVVTADSNGLTEQVSHTNWSNLNPMPFGAFAISDPPGSYDVIGVDAISNTSSSTTLVPVPMMSVPLPASGLTNGATYHVVMRQQGAADPNNHTLIGTTNGALPSDALTSATPIGPWSAIQAGHSIPLTVYNAATDPSQEVWHFWEDPRSTGSGYTANLASSTTTITYADDGRLLGLLESTLFPNSPLNVNPTFSSSASPWTAVNGTITRSNAQTHGGFAFSGLLTPTGGNPTASAVSEKIPIGVNKYVSANAWVYVPTTWPSVSLSLSWYDSSGSPISVTSSAVSVTGTTWTNLSTLDQAPNGAAFVSLTPTLGGTPAPANTLFLSNIVLTLAPQDTVTSAAQVIFDGVTKVPIGAKQLA